MIITRICSNEGESTTSNSVRGINKTTTIVHNKKEKNKTIIFPKSQRSVGVMSIKTCLISESAHVKPEYFCSITLLCWHPEQRKYKRTVAGGEKKRVEPWRRANKRQPWTTLKKNAAGQLIRAKRSNMLENVPWVDKKALKRIQIPRTCQQSDSSSLLQSSRKQPKQVVTWRKQILPAPTDSFE